MLAHHNRAAPCDTSPGMRENERGVSWRDQQQSTDPREGPATLAPRSLNPQVDLSQRSGAPAMKLFVGVCSDADAEAMLGIRGAADAQELDLSNRFALRAAAHQSGREHMGLLWGFRGSVGFRSV